jgi:cyclohexadienyl dehydratase
MGQTGPIRAADGQHRLAGVLAALWLTPAAAGEPAGALRVGTSADYAPFSHAKNERADPEGFDVALVRAWAAERGRKIVFVRFHWQQLVSALAAGRFDVAASGVTVRPDRSVAGRFTVAVAETEAIALARNPERWGGSATLDRPQIRIAVNRGGHLEQVARASFPNATLVAVPDNDQVIELLIDEQVDAVVTDGAEAPLWEKRADQPLARIGPLSRDRKAWLVRAEEPELAADFDAWLLAREADGTIAKLREQWLGEPKSARTAEPLRALLAALDERLALMPLVGVVKRRDGVALVVPEREKLVLERTLADLRAEAKRTGRKAPPDRACARYSRPVRDRAIRAAARGEGFGLSRAGATPRSGEGAAPGAVADRRTHRAPAARAAAVLEGAAVRNAARDALRAPYLDARAATRSPTRSPRAARFPRATRRTSRRTRVPKPGPDRDRLA